MLSPVARSQSVGRYAPSPTGRLHLGNLHTAIVAHDDIRSRGGIFILRMEDTDTPRNVNGTAEQIIQDLNWLGIDWDEGPDIGGPAAAYNQSRRGHIYQQALFQLARRGLIYSCTCTRKDLQSAASAPHGSDGPVYPGTCRPVAVPASDESEQFLARFLATPWQRRDACLRLRTDRLPGPITFHDEIHGPQSHNLTRECGDFVILRRDGLWAYQFVCAVDDALMGITRVVRGADLLTSTPRQVAIIQALGFTPPIYRHIPLLLDAAGDRMSKRDGSASLENFQRRGLTPAQARQIIQAQPFSS